MSKINPFSEIGMETSGSTLVTPFDSSSITVAKFGSDDPENDVEKALAEQDAYLLIAPLRDLTHHDFWIDGRHEHRDDFKPDEFTVVDLHSPAACRIVGPFDYLQVHIPRSAIHDLSRDFETRVDTLQIGQEWKVADPVVAGLKDCLASAVSQPTGTAQLFIDHVVLALRTHIARVYGGMELPSRRMMGGLAAWQERRAKELLASDLSQNLSMQHVAQECQLSVAHFSRSFKISAGTTPHEWLQCRRVERARSLLAEHSQPLAEIALQCGFSDQSHFTRMFARIEGVTPGVWRRTRSN